MPLCHHKCGAIHCDLLYEQPWQHFLCLLLGFLGSSPSALVCDGTCVSPNEYPFVLPRTELGCIHLLGMRVGGFQSLDKKNSLDHFVRYLMSLLLISAGNTCQGWNLLALEAQVPKP